VGGVSFGAGGGGYATYETVIDDAGK